VQWKSPTSHSSNIANVDTPGHKRVDVSFQDALAEALTAGRKAVGALNFVPQTEAGGPARADGNTVSIEQESAEFAPNGLFYDTLLAVKKARGDIVKTAAGLR
jgi:flagellar basal-body rod protein FlgB